MVIAFIVGDVIMLKTGIDEVDLNILSSLQENSRTPFTRIAEKLGVSDATIHLWVKKMEDMGLMRSGTS